MGTALGLALAISASAACAEANKPSGTDPTFGSRTDKPDGSASVTIGRRLPTSWETKVGTDVSLAAPAGSTLSDDILRGTMPERSSGAVWGTLTMPGFQPLGFDKTSVNARLDAGKDEGKIGATLSRSMPIDQNFSVTLQNDYSVTQALSSDAGAEPALPLMAAPSVVGAGNPAATGPVWSAGETVRLNVVPSGTTIAAGAGSSTADNQWHSKLSLEQSLIGPLKVTTSVENAGAADSNKSITAGFKRVW